MLMLSSLDGVSSRGEFVVMFLAPWQIELFFYGWYFVHLFLRFE